MAKKRKDKNTFTIMLFMNKKARNYSEKSDLKFAFFRFLEYN